MNEFFNAVEAAIRNIVRDEVSKALTGEAVAQALDNGLTLKIQHCVQDELATNVENAVKEVIRTGDELESAVASAIRNDYRISDELKKVIEEKFETLEFDISVR